MGCRRQILGPITETFRHRNGRRQPYRNLDHDLGNAVLLYGISSYGAKAGGFNPAVPAFSNGAFEPIHVEGEAGGNCRSELGLKSELLDRHVILNLNAYWESAFDYQTTALELLPDGTRKVNIANAGTVRSQGSSRRDSKDPIGNRALVFLEL